MRQFKATPYRQLAVLSIPHVEPARPDLTFDLPPIFLVAGFPQATLVQGDHLPKANGPAAAPSIIRPATSRLSYRPLFRTGF